MEHESTIRQAKDQDRAEISEAHRSAFGAH